MNWDDYKKRCDNPRVFSRWMLEQTADLVDEPQARALRDVMRARPLDKPADHKGGSATDMFELDLDQAVGVAILEAVQAAVAEGRTSAGTRERGLGGFVAAWTEHRDAR